MKILINIIIIMFDIGFTITMIFKVMSLTNNPELIGLSISNILLATLAIDAIIRSIVRIFIDR